MSDFWKTLAGNSSSQLLTGSMDSLLSGRANGEDFEKMRVLTDTYREANALELPVEAGTKVSFIGTLGAYMAYDNPPPEGSVGEVVQVKSANGDITHNDGKVFIQWDDGEFRPVHAEHLRLASVKSEKTAPTSKTARDQTLMTWTYHGSDGDGGKTTTIVAEIKVDGRGNLLLEENYKQEDWGGAPARSHSTEKRLGTVRDPDLQTASRIFSDKKKGWTAKGRRLRSPIQYLKKVLGEQSGRLASDIKQQFEKIKGMAEKKPDNDFLKSLLKQMADKGFAPTDKQMAVVKKIEKEIEQQGQMKKELGALVKKKGEFDASEIGEEKKGPIESDSDEPFMKGHFTQTDQGELTRAIKNGSQFRVASLGDLTDFLKVAEGQLIHRSTQDLWNVVADGEGFTITRLFDDNGNPLKG